MEYTHLAEYNYNCTYCTQSFTGKESLRAHMMIHKRTFPCAWCNKSFYSKTQLSQHEKNHRKVKCCICQKSCDSTCKNKQVETSNMSGSSEVELSNMPGSYEVGSSHQPQGSKVCEKTQMTMMAHNCVLCNKSFSSKRHLRQHAKIHRKVLVKCCVCKKSASMLNKSIELSNSPQSTTAESSHIIQSQKAESSYTHESSKMESSEFEPSHMPGSTKEFIEKTYPTTKRIRNPFFTCRECSESFARSCTYLLPDLKPQVKCYICDQLFMKNEDLTLHRKEKHPNWSQVVWALGDEPYKNSIIKLPVFNAADEDITTNIHSFQRSLATYF